MTLRRPTRASDGSDFEYRRTDYGVTPPVAPCSGFFALFMQGFSPHFVIPALVCERHNPQLHALYDIKNAIGKTPQRKAPRHRAPRRSEVWVLAQDLEGTLKFDL